MNWGTWVAVVLVSCALAACGQAPIKPAANHLRAEEAARVEDGEAVVRFGGEVDDDVDLLLREDLLDELEVPDVALHQTHVDSVQVAGVAGVCEQVEPDDVVRGMPRQPVADEVRADEARSACDKQPLSAHEVLLRRRLRTKSLTS